MRDVMRTIAQAGVVGRSCPCCPAVVAVEGAEGGWGLPVVPLQAGSRPSPLAPSTAVPLKHSMMHLSRLPNLPSPLPPPSSHPPLQCHSKNIMMRDIKPQNVSRVGCSVDRTGRLLGRHRGRMDADCVLCSMNSLLQLTFVPPTLSLCPLPLRPAVHVCHTRGRLPPQGRRLWHLCVLQARPVPDHTCRSVQ